MTTSAIVKNPNLSRISVRLYFNTDCICIGGLALKTNSKKFNFSGDYFLNEDVQIYPSQDVVGKDWPAIYRERKEILCKLLQKQTKKVG